MLYIQLQHMHCIELTHDYYHDGFRHPSTDSTSFRRYYPAERFLSGNFLDISNFLPGSVLRVVLFRRSFVYPHRCTLPSQHAQHFQHLCQWVVLRQIAPC